MTRHLQMTGGNKMVVSGALVDQGCGHGYYTWLSRRCRSYPFHDELFQQFQRSSTFLVAPRTQGGDPRSRRLTRRSKHRQAGCCSWSLWPRRHKRAVMGITDALMEASRLVVLDRGNRCRTFSDRLGRVSRARHRWHQRVQLHEDATAASRKPTCWPAPIHEVPHRHQTSPPAAFWWDIPKDAADSPTGRTNSTARESRSRFKYLAQGSKGDNRPDHTAGSRRVEKSRAPVVYTGRRAVINSGDRATQFELRELGRRQRISDQPRPLHGGSGPIRRPANKLAGMLGMHGLYEANWAMHGLRLHEFNIGARFWTTASRAGTDAFSP